MKSIYLIILSTLALSLSACDFGDKFDGETISKYSQLGQCMLKCYETSEGPAPEEIRIVEE